MAIHLSRGFFSRFIFSSKVQFGLDRRALWIQSFQCSKRDGGSVPDVNTVGDFHSSVNQEETGKVYDKKPFKFTCEKGKSYSWCSCGHSKTQPFCDGTHKSSFLNIKLRPVRFVPGETKEYWLCNCKQTKNRPFCDGTHRLPSVQEQIKN